MLNMGGLPLCIGVVLGTVSAYSDRYGNKSFTNDPLGWRAAKKTYDKTDVPPEALKPASEDPKV